MEPRSTTRTATISFLITAAAAVSLFVVWRFWRTEEVILPAIRGPGEVTLDWKCLAGHSFRAPGQVETHPCVVCGTPAYPFGIWECEEHGGFEVIARLQLDGEGVLRPLEFRILPDGGWVPASDILECPACGERLKRRLRDPLGGLPRPKKQRGLTPPRGG